MRDVLLIAFHEHLQPGNWTGGDPALDAFSICARIVPARRRLGSVGSLDDLLSPDSIGRFLNDLGAAMEGCAAPAFRDPEGWQGFLRDLTVEFSIEEIGFPEAGAYILSQLYRRHVTTFRLLSVWLILGAVGRVMGHQMPVVSDAGFGRLIRELSAGGPPIWDVENMRGTFPDMFG